ncbi:MAG: hypothetical protein ACK40K_01330 [Raineya sp.]
MKQIGFFIVFFSFVLLFSVKAQKTNYQLVRNLNEQWLHFDKSYNHYVAYTKNLHQNSQMVHFWLKPEQWKNYYLLLHLEEDGYLFINHNIQKKFLKGKNYLFLDSLAKIYPQKNIFMSMYALKPNFLRETLIVSNKLQEQTTNVFLDKDKAFYNFLRSRVSVFLVVLLLGYAILRQYDPKLLFTYLQFSKFLQIQRRLDNPLFLRFFQNSNLIFLLIYLGLLTTFFVIMEAVAPSGEPFILGQYNNNLSAYKLSWVNVLVWYGLLVAWLFAKYFIILVTSNLLGLSRIVNIHFYEYVRITHWFFLPLTAISILLCLHLPYQMESWYLWLKSFLFLSYVLRLAIVAYNINSLAEFRKLDFYSYLCVSEIIPLLVFAKILFFT